MFSDCNSSRISSVDSYTTVTKDNYTGSQGLDDLADELSLSGSYEESTASFISRRSTSSNAFSFSSDSDFLHNLENRRAPKSKSPKIGNSCSPSDTTVAVPKPKPRRTRSPMGTYIPPPGGEPLTRSYFSSPGPAAYYPDVSVVKNNAPQYLLKFRQKLRQEQLLGPGPATYMLNKQCCPLKYVESHFAKRFEESTSDGPGPGAFDLNAFNQIGRHKPKALIVSRHTVKAPKSSGTFENIYGMTRKGAIRAPFALLISKPIEISKRQPGPGCYDPHKSRDRRVPIKMKGRWKTNFGIDMNILGPQYFPLSPINGPFWPLVGKWNAKSYETDSPGPIYKPMTDQKKPLSMTFLPFPVRGKELEPSPLTYSRVGEQSLKTKPNGPKALIVSRRDPDFGLFRSPGPNHYFPPSKIGFSSHNQISMKGRWKSTKDCSPGSGAYNLANKGRRAPSCVFTSKYKTKPLLERSPGYKYTPKLDKGTTRNVFIAGRWKPVTKSSDNAQFYDLTGFTSHGKYSRRAVSLKSRHTPFMYNGTSTSPTIPFAGQCKIETMKYDVV